MMCKGCSIMAVDFNVFLFVAVCTCTGKAFKVGFGV